MSTINRRTSRIALTALAALAVAAPAAQAAPARSQLCVTPPQAGEVLILATSERVGMSVRDAQAPVARAFAGRSAEAIAIIGSDEYFAASCLVVQLRKATISSLRSRIVGVRAPVGSDPLGWSWGATNMGSAARRAYDGLGLVVDPTNRDTVYSFWFGGVTSCLPAPGAGEALIAGTYGRATLSLAGRPRGLTVGRAVLHDASVRNRRASALAVTSDTNRDGADGACIRMRHANGIIGVLIGMLVPADTAPAELVVPTSSRLLQRAARKAYDLNPNELT